MSYLNFKQSTMLKKSIDALNKLIDKLFIEYLV